MYRLLLLVLFLSGYTAYSQEIAYKQFSVKEGVPGSTIYQAVQDKNGYLWFATNQGVSRFDGRSFKNFTKEDGLPDNEILKIYIDKHNNIWFISLIGIPSVYCNGQIKQFNECKGITAMAEDFINDSIHLISGANPFYGYYRSKNSSGKWQFNANEKNPGQISTFFGVPILRASSSQGPHFYFSIIKSGLLSLSVKTNKQTQSYLYATTASKTGVAFTFQSFFCLSENKNKIIFYTPDSVFHLANKKIVGILALKDLHLNVEKENDVTSILYENDSTFWLCTRTQGLLRIKNFLQSNRSITYYFRNSFCTSILKDKESGYWVTTHDDGAYYIPNLDFHYMSHTSKLVTKDVKCIRAISEDRLVAGFANGNIIAIDPKRMNDKLYADWTSQNKNNRVLDISPYVNQNFLVASDFGIYIFPGRQMSIQLSSTVGAKAIFVSYDKSILIAFADRLELRKPGQAPKNIFSQRTTCTTGLGEKYFWGTLKGMYQWSADSIYNLGLVYPALSGIINHIDIASDSAIWVSTQRGIVILKHDSIQIIKKENGLLSNMCKHILLKKNTAWVSTDHGISRIDFDWNNEKFAYSISNITEEDGLTSNDVNQTALCNGFIWAATSRGISFFPNSHISHSNWLPLINLTKILVGTQEVFEPDTILLTNQNNKILIELSAISYRSGNQVYYEYRLANIDTIWNRVPNNTIEFTTLPYGRFEFEVRAIDRWGKKSDHPKKIIIFHKPPFWKATWFAVLSYLLTALIIGSVVYLFSRIRHQKKDRENQRNKMIHDLEMMALRAQMNPHFIFNCLSSIQHYILRADALNANLYLHKFSTLIRKTLHRSSSYSISLSEEISILALYMELEKLRLEDRLEYKISYSDNIFYDDIHIPAMIIQPYVENAIKHGIAPLNNEQGFILIDLKRTDNKINCTIEDNGVGINASKKSKQSWEHHQSMGMSITENRINAMNSIQKDEISVNVIDKQESNPPDRGTIVQLSFTI